MDIFTITSGATTLSYGKTVEELGAPREGETNEEAFFRAKASEAYLKLHLKVDSSEGSDDQTPV